MGCPQKTYYTVKTYVWKKKTNSNEKKNNNCSKELPQYQKFDNLYKVFLFLFFCSQWHFYSLLCFYTSFFSSFFAQSILVTLLVKKKCMHLFECVFRSQF